MRCCLFPATVVFTCMAWGHNRISSHVDFIPHRPCSFCANEGRPARQRKASKTPWALFYCGMAEFHLVWREHGYLMGIKTLRLTCLHTKELTDWITLLWPTGQTWCEILVVVVGLRRRNSLQATEYVNQMSTASARLTAHKMRKSIVSEIGCSKEVEQNKFKSICK